MLLFVLCCLLCLLLVLFDDLFVGVGSLCVFLFYSCLCVVYFYVLIVVCSYFVARDNDGLCCLLLGVVCLLLFVFGLWFVVVR